MSVFVGVCVVPVRLEIVFASWSKASGMNQSPWLKGKVFVCIRKVSREWEGKFWGVSTVQTMCMEHTVLCKEATWIKMIQSSFCFFFSCYDICPSQYNNFPQHPSFPSLPLSLTLPVSPCFCVLKGDIEMGAMASSLSPLVAIVTEGRGNRSSV